MADETATPATAPFTDLGISGIPRYGSVSRVYDEFLRQLQGPQGMKLYREAIDNCPIVGAFLFALQHLSKNVTFRVDPAADPTVDRRLAAQVAERVAGALFDDLDVPWPDQLSEILSMVPYGWALCELTYKRCLGPTPPQQTSPFLPPPVLPGPWGQGADAEPFTPSKFTDGWISWKSWGLRAQDTLHMWEWNADSKATVMQQMAPPDYRVRRIPLSKALLFRAQINKANPEGRSVIRNAIPSYLYRKNIQNIEAIGIERDLAGYPVFQVKEPDQAKGLMPPDVWNTKDPQMLLLRGQIEGMARKIKNDEQAGLFLPYWLQFTLASTNGRRNFDTNAIIARYDQRIAMVMLADFILLGHDAVGSKALASTKSSLFTTALNSFLESACAVVNRFAIPQLLALNGVPPALAPTLQHGDAENVPIEAIGNYIGQLAKAGMPLFPNADLEEALLDAAKLPTSGVSDPGERPFEEDPSGLDTLADGEDPPAPQPAAAGSDTFVKQLIARLRKESTAV
jgi:hypothetical protein